MTKILIDCDPGHDDAVALLFAARHLELVGITTVHGNSTLDNTTRNALALLELAGLETAVARGCAGPLVGSATHAAHIHGSSGLDGATLPPPTRQPVAAHAVDFIIDQAERHRGELVLAVIGPQTNLAMALRREPRLAGWLREITVMGGSTTTGNVTPAAEFNIYGDPEAAAAVFASGIPIRMVGLNVTRRTGFAAADVARLRGSGRRVAAVIADLLAFYLERQREAFRLDLAPMHDVCAIIPYVFPELIRYGETFVQIELAGAATRGMTVCDLRSLHPGTTLPARLAKTCNAHVALEADSRLLIDRVIETILTYP
ncbi:nucleoside hydrolase [Vineibacter terrae]|uniref:nucleoside hydrolase n=1 Tax=Vineibacter terrae TaxID=2586908 RepID=UPI002E31596D|nr:nucleoside hydrolase [Vineibacter terrae]HEX2891625.1 nucleoside hydrolase [Vineibacter terrae]